MDFNRDPKK